MEITSIEQMRDYIYRKLGAPVLVVEVAPEQIDDCIFDTVQDMRRYNYDDGSTLEYSTLVTKAGVSEYSVKDSGIDIEAAYDIQLTFGLDGINTLFTPTHMLLYNDWVTKGQHPGGSGYSHGVGGMILTQYETAMQYLEMNKMYFGKHYVVKYDTNKEAFIVMPTPSVDMVASIAFYRRADAVRLYNHPLVKRLAVARAKVQWGLHLSKYNVTLPDGLGIQGSDLISQGREDEDKYLNDMRHEAPSPDFFIG